LTGDEVPSQTLFESTSRGVAAEAAPQVDGYHAVRCIGSGSTAVVWLVEQLRPFRRHVAMKVYRDPRESASILDRFRSERDMLARLPRSGFCAIYDAGIARDGRPYITMEFVDGADLLCAARRARDSGSLCELFIRVAETVAEVHDLGILHLDLKPSNVLVERRGSEPWQPTVIDFGFSVSQGGRSAGGGSRGFAAPEVVAGGIPSRASDVYSLAAMLHVHLHEVPAGRHSHLERGLLRVARRGLEPDPKRRPQDARAFSLELASARRRSRARSWIVRFGPAVAILFAAAVAWAPSREPSPTPASRSEVVRERRRLKVPTEFPTVQSAIDAAANGDVVQIAPGLYREAVSIDGKSVSLHGCPGSPSACVLDAGGSGRITLAIHNVDPALTTIRDLTITHSGVADRQGCGVSYQSGGAVPIRFERCIVRDNISTNDGLPGGMNLLGHAVLEACVFIRNEPGHRGAAVSVYDGCTVELIDCCFRDHHVGKGLISVRDGGVAVLDGCVILGSNRLAEAHKSGRIVFRNCRGSEIGLVGGTGFIDGGANHWDACVDEDGDGIPELEQAILGEG